MINRRFFQKLALVALPALALSACGDQAGGSAASRDHVTVVGSSTVFPFANMAAEAFKAANASFVVPKVESTGTGGGIERFCAGVGAATPDIVNASRRMKASEFQTCAQNGVTDIIEIQIGLDGLALGESVNGPRFNLTQEDIYRALAANPYGQPNTARTWRDVNPALPAVAISVYGPPSTSGTYDAFKELILGKGCEANPEMRALKDSDKDRYEAICHTLRGAPEYVEQGENDNLIIQKLVRNPNSLGLFGFSYLDANRAQIRDVSINGVEATTTTVANGTYPGSRPLYIYIKRAHIGVIPGLQQYVQMFVTQAAPGGPLSRAGLIPLSADLHATSVRTAADLPLLTAAQLN
ncbi:MAG: substrate-binding domain-containing protein [Sphingopyxis sp.]|nr:substrate-binding domain-containing protein [Sphingopyxis sp.]